MNNEHQDTPEQGVPLAAVAHSIEFALIMAGEARAPAAVIDHLLDALRALGPADDEISPQALAASSLNRR